MQPFLKRTKKVVANKSAEEIYLNDFFKTLNPKEGRK